MYMYTSIYRVGLPWLPESQVQKVLKDYLPAGELKSKTEGLELTEEPCGSP